MLLLGDYREHIDKIPDGSINLLLTDPPYRINYTTGSATNSAKQNSWKGLMTAGDATLGFSEVSFDTWLGDIYPKMAQQSHLYIFVNDKNMQMILNAIQKAGFLLHNILVWSKNNKTPNRWYMKNAEFIIFARKGKSFPIKNMSSAQILEFDNVAGKDKLHPTQKPVELGEYLILNSTNIGDTVCDLFMGSGSFGVATKKTNRRFIGIEIDKKYFDIAQGRINNIK